MYVAGRLVTTIAFAALAPAVLAGQAPAPGDLADLCKTVGQGQVGQWAAFDATGSSGSGKLRLAVVGSERSGDTTLYWFEVNAAGKDPTPCGVSQMPAPSPASGTVAPPARMVKGGRQPAGKVSGQSADM